MGKITNTLLRLGLFVMLLLGITATTALAQDTLYTAPGASTTATCAATDPCDLAAAIDKATGGDIIAFAAGNYNVNTATPINVDVALTFTGWDGSATTPLLGGAVTANLGGSFDFNVADSTTLTLADEFVLAFTGSADVNLGNGAAIVSGPDGDADADAFAEGAVAFTGSGNSMITVPINPDSAAIDNLIIDRSNPVRFETLDRDVTALPATLTINRQLDVRQGAFSVSSNNVLDLDFSLDEGPIFNIAEDAEVSSLGIVQLTIVANTVVAPADTFSTGGLGDLNATLYVASSDLAEVTITFPNIGGDDESIVGSDTTVTRVVFSNATMVEKGLKVQNNSQAEFGKAVTIDGDLRITGAGAPPVGEAVLPDAYSSVIFNALSTIDGDLTLEGDAVLDLDLNVATNGATQVNGNLVTADLVDGDVQYIAMQAVDFGTTPVAHYHSLAVTRDLNFTDAPIIDMEAPVDLVFDALQVCTVDGVEDDYVTRGTALILNGAGLADINLGEAAEIPTLVIEKTGASARVDLNGGVELAVPEALIVVSGMFVTNGDLNSVGGAVAVTSQAVNGNIVRGTIERGDGTVAYAGDPALLYYLGDATFATGDELPGTNLAPATLLSLVVNTPPTNGTSPFTTLGRDITVSGILGLCEGLLDVGSAELTLGNGVDIVIKNATVEQRGNTPFEGDLVFPEVDPEDAGIDGFGIDLFYVTTQDPHPVGLEFPTADVDSLVVTDVTVNSVGAVQLAEGNRYQVNGDITLIDGQLDLNGSTLDWRAANIVDPVSVLSIEQEGELLIDSQGSGLLLLTGDEPQNIVLTPSLVDVPDDFILPAVEINKPDPDPTDNNVVTIFEGLEEGGVTEITFASLNVIEVDAVGGLVLDGSVERMEVVTDFNLAIGEFLMEDIFDSEDGVCDLYASAANTIDDDMGRQRLLVGQNFTTTGTVSAEGGLVVVNGTLAVNDGVFDGGNEEFTLVSGNTDEDSEGIGAFVVGPEGQFILASGQIRILGDYDFQGDYDVTDDAQGNAQGARGTIFFEGPNVHTVSMAQDPDAYMNNVWMRGAGDVVLASDIWLNDIGFEGWACPDPEDEDPGRYEYGGAMLTLQRGAILGGEFAVNLTKPVGEDNLANTNNPDIPSGGAVQLGTRDSFVDGIVSRPIAEANATGGVITGGYFFPLGTRVGGERAVFTPLILQFDTSLPEDQANLATVALLDPEDPAIDAANAAIDANPLVVSTAAGPNTLTLNFLNPTRVFYRVEFDAIPAEDPNIRVIAGDLIGRVDDINALRLVAFDCDGTNPRMAGTYDENRGTVDDESSLENDFINGVPNITMEGVEVAKTCMLITVATDQFINPLGPDAVDRALVQFIHAAPSVGAGDLEIEGRLTREDFGYGEATPFLRIPVEEDGNQIQLIVGDEAVLSDGINLEADENYIVVIAEDEDGAIRILVENARTEARNQDMVEIVAVNAMWNHPMIDIVNWDAQTVPFNNIAFADYSRYQPFQPEVINFEIVDQDAGASLNVVRAELGEFTGDALAAVAVDDPVVGPTLLLIAANGVVVQQQVVTDAEEASELPAEFALNGNYPNPFNPSTTISFNLPQNADVTVEVVDMLGRRVMTVPVQTMQAGMNRTIQLNATELASGVYLYRVIAKMADQTRVETGRMTLLK